MAQSMLYTLVPLAGNQRPTTSAQVHQTLFDMPDECHLPPRVQMQCMQALRRKTLPCWQQWLLRHEKGQAGRTDLECPVRGAEACMMLTEGPYGPLTTRKGGVYAS